jgi:hypothetical protein
VFFENTRCINCGHSLAYVPELARMAALEPAGTELWRVPARSLARHRYRLCDNYSRENVCNWAMPADDPQRLCESCRLTRLLPDLSVPGNREAWFRLETAKRRMLYTLMQLRCPIESRAEDARQGLVYEFRSDSAGSVLTGHASGVITLNIAEADDAERERRRLQLHEPYRTLLGHFRHEVGHYYWQRLIDNSPRLESFRGVFGDERADYAAALKRHYEQGPPGDWQQRFVSAYATAHPWEDWAESWAHYLHMTDMLETAAACGLSLRPSRRDEPALARARSGTDEPFEWLIGSWFPLTYILNNLNRSMGLADGYPFVLSTPAIAKLRFVHDTIIATQIAPPSMSATGSP